MGRLLDVDISMSRRAGGMSDGTEMSDGREPSDGR